MKEEILYEAIAEDSPVGYLYAKIIYNDIEEAKDYKIIQLNKSCESILNIKRENLIGEKISQIYENKKKDASSWNKFYANVINNTKHKRSEYYLNFINKHYRIKTLIPKKGYIIIYLTDISHQTIEADKLNILSDNVPIQVWYLSDSTTYISANKAHADFTGFKKTDFIFKDLKELFSKKVSKICIQENIQVFKEKKQIQVNSWLDNSNNEKRLLRLTKNPKFNSKGEIDFVVCSAEDITEEFIIKEKNKLKDRILYSSMAFTKELLTNNDHYDALSNGLEIIGNAAQVDRVYYWENHYDEASGEWLTSQKFEWCLDGVTRQIENPELQNILFEDAGDFIKTLSQNKSFSGHIRNMDNQKGNTQKILKAQNILSILAIPVFIKDEFRGFIGFDSCKLEKEWSEIEISLLSSFVFLYKKAIERNFLQNRILQIKDNFNNFFNMIQDFLFVLDLEGNIIDINKTVLEKLNYSKDELLGKAISILHTEDSLKETENNIENLINKKINSWTTQAIKKDGTLFPVDIIVSEGIWNEKQVLFVVSKDISKLTMSEEKFSRAFNDSGINMFISKFEDGKILELNDKLLDFIGYKREELLGKTTLDLKAIHGYDNREILKKEINIYGKISDIEIKFLNKDNTSRTGLVNIVPLNINNELCLLSSIIDVTERVAYEAKILEISNRDSLTGVYSRLYVYERAKEILEEYKRDKNIFSISIIDIDNFKYINDNFGHQAGDFILKQFTEIINENLRPYDILGRYGGEEFIIILNHSSKKDSNMILERILNIVRNKIFIFDANDISLTFSAGISSSKELNKNEITIDKLVGIADKRMYMAKNDGKNKIVYE